MDKFRVSLINNAYDVVVTESYHEVVAPFLKGKKVCVITDENVFNLYGNPFKNKFNVVCECVIPAGETHKNIDTLKPIINKMLSAHISRKDVVVAFGGGVVGDIAGFVASCYMRGIEYVQVPTTLLAMVDSSIGGKTGVDIDGIKNIMGAFHQPKIVAINPKFVHTLNEKELKCGLGECVKYAMLEEKIFDFFKRNEINSTTLKQNQDVLKELICLCAKSKVDVVSSDEKENGLRKILNLGHTVGHGLETLQCCGDMASHGIYVMLGMLAELNISFKMKKVKEAYYDACVKLIKSILDKIEVVNIDIDNLIEIMLCDKKNAGEFISVILPIDVAKVKEEMIGINDIKKCLEEFYAKN